MLHRKQQIILKGSRVSHGPKTSEPSRASRANTTRHTFLLTAFQQGNIMCGSLKKKFIVLFVEYFICLLHSLLWNNQCPHSLRS